MNEAASELQQPSSIQKEHGRGNPVDRFRQSVDVLTGLVAGGIKPAAEILERTVGQIGSDFREMCVSAPDRATAVLEEILINLGVGRPMALATCPVFVSEAAGANSSRDIDPAAITAGWLLMRDASRGWGDYGQSRKPKYGVPKRGSQSEMGTGRKIAYITTASLAAILLAFGLLRGCQPSVPDTTGATPTPAAGKTETVPAKTTATAGRQATSTPTPPFTPTPTSGERSLWEELQKLFGGGEPKAGEPTPQPGARKEEPFNPLDPDSWGKAIKRVVGEELDKRGLNPGAAIGLGENPGAEEARAIYENELKRLYTAPSTSAEAQQVRDYIQEINARWAAALENGPKAWGIESLLKDLLNTNAKRMSLEGNKSPTGPGGWQTEAQAYCETVWVLLRKKGIDETKLRETLLDVYQAPTDSGNDELNAQYTEDVDLLVTVLTAYKNNQPLSGETIGKLKALYNARIKYEKDPKKDHWNDPDKTSSRLTPPLFTQEGRLVRYTGLEGYVKDAFKYFYAEEPMALGSLLNESEALVVIQTGYIVDNDFLERWGPQGIATLSGMLRAEARTRVRTASLVQRQRELAMTGRRRATGGRNA